MTEPDPNTEIAPSGGQPRDEDLAGMVDDMERRVTDERRERGVPGNADDRAEAEPIVSGDEAPE